MLTLARNALRPTLLALGAAYLLGGAATAQPLLVASPGSLIGTSAGALAQASEAELRADITFARGLANWSFVELSQEVIARLERANPPTALAEEVALLKCEVYFAAARTDAKNRERLLKQAIDAYTSFLSRSSFNDESKALAEAGLVEASSAYARTLAGRLEDALGDEKATLRAEIQDVLASASRRAGTVVDGYLAIPSEERSPEQKRKVFELLLAQGEMLLELGKAEELGDANFNFAIQKFERLSDESGEGTPWSMRAMIGIADVYAAQGKWDEAAAYYEFPVNFSIPIDLAAWQEAVKQNEMTTEEKQARFLFVQLGTPGLAKALAAQGDSQAAIQWSLHLYNTWRREGLDLVQPQGYLALLDVARLLVDFGGVIGGNTAAGEARWFATAEEAAANNVPKRSQRSALDFALSLAQIVANENKGTTLLVRAQQVIGAIISRPGIQVDPTVLFDAAQGDFNASEFEPAIAAFKRVILALDSADQAARTELMPKVLWHIGRSYARLDRQLEAAMTYELALESWAGGDAVWDEQNATGFNSAATALKRQAKGDAQVEALVRKSEEILARTSGGAANDILFRAGEAALEAKKYDEARTKYRAVTGGNFREKAIVALGICDYRQGKFDAAIQIFDDYLTKYITDAKNAETDPTRLAKRKEARASATFYWGLSLYKLAEKGSGDWRAVVNKLGKYHEEFPEQTRFAPAALYQTLMAWVKLGEQAQVRAVLETMLTLYPDDTYTGNAAKESYVALETQRNGEQDEAKRRRLLVEMAENLETLNRTSPKPSFANMRRESTHWIELGEWAKAEDLLKRIRMQFAADASAEEIMLKGVLPDLGLALIRQYKVQEAAEVLAPLNAKDAKYRATKPTATNYARALTGWVEMTTTADGKLGGPKEVPGIGGAENFETGAIIINQLAGSAEKWTADWFQYKLDQIYAFHQWSKLDSKKAEVAKTDIAFLANPTNLGPQFRHDQMPEDLRQLFVWLLAQVGR